MAGRIKRIVDYVKQEVYLKNLAVARLNISLGGKINVEDFTDETPDDPEIEKKLIETAKSILNVTQIDIP